MGNQQKLNALLFELQAAQSPLAQAKIIARAWRTVRELSPTDRKLLARHAGFDGAEEILEGLATHSGGFAPAMLLQMLAKARASDGRSVSQLVSALRDPSTRQETIARGFDMASELLVRPEIPKEEDEEVGEALDELRAVEDSVAETPEEALAALNDLASENPMHSGEEHPEDQTKPTIEAASIPVEERAAKMDRSPERELPEIPETRPASSTPSPPTRSDTIDWKRWEVDTGSRRHATPHVADDLPSIESSGSRRFDAKTVMGALGAEGSVFSQLRVLHRELSGFAGSSVETLGELIEGFPDGWARRRALSALLGAGIPSGSREAVLLVALLENERDRSWCLGVLARRGNLRGGVLRQAVELVTSPYARRRVQSAADSVSEAPRTDHSVVP